jgi:hypothetical protein
MGLVNIAQSVQTLIDHWVSRGVTISPGNRKKIEDFKISASYNLPKDFIEFYSRVNGMSALYPNETDENGFLFYPIEAVKPAIDEIKKTDIQNIDRIFVFCDYLQCSWWYGCNVINPDAYSIGIIANRNNFSPICSSLSEFIDLYISDSPRLYSYT